MTLKCALPILQTELFLHQRGGIHAPPCHASLSVVLHGYRHSKCRTCCYVRSRHSCCPGVAMVGPTIRHCSEVNQPSQSHCNLYLLDSTAPLLWHFSVGSRVHADSNANLDVLLDCREYIAPSMQLAVCPVAFVCIRCIQLCSPSAAVRRCQ